MFPDLKGKPSMDIIEEKIVGVMPSMDIYFPEEIIAEILVRLPVQYLVRFKCVSKSWNTLISDPDFKAKYCHHAKKNKKILIAQMLPGAGKVSYYCSSLSSSSSAQPLQKQLDCPSNYKPFGYIVLCCCDGLILLWYRGDHLLWNPSTNESVQLPNHEFSDATRSTYGLGYDPITDEYKILMIDNIGSDSKPLNRILALKCGSSRNIDNHPRGFRNSVRPEDSLAFVRGAFHWICGDNLFKYFMISFNISNEVYGEISLPEGICNISDLDDVTCAVSVLDGMLCAYCTCRGTEADTFKLWVMKDYGVEESWTELFTIRETHLLFAIPKYKFADGEVLLYYKHGLYNGFRTSKGPFEWLPACHAYIRGFVYTESLISPKSLI